MAPTQASQNTKDPKKLLDESAGQVKPGPTSSVQAGSAIAPVQSPSKEDQSSSKRDDSKLPPDEELERKLHEQQADRVMDLVLSQLDWDLKHSAPDPGFKPFYFFCTSVYSEKPDLKQVLSNLKGTTASRFIKGGAVETGQAWEFKDEKSAQDLRAKVEQQVPKLYLGYDLVTIGSGKPQSCKVVCTY